MRIFLTVLGLVVAPSPASAQQVSVGVDTSVTRFGDANQSVVVGGTALTVVYAPTSAWTLALEQSMFKPVDSAGDARLRRPMVTARFLPSTRPAAFGVLLEAAPPIVDGAYGFDRRDPDVAVDGICALRTHAAVESRLSVGAGFQYANPDSECFGRLSSVLMLRGKLATVVTTGRWSVQPRLEVRHYIMETIKDGSVVHASLHGAFQMSEGWSVTASTEIATVVNDPRFDARTGLKLGLGIVRHFGAVRALASESGVTTPRRLVVPIAHCS